MLRLLNREQSQQDNFALQQGAVRLRFLVAAEGSPADTH